MCVCAECAEKHLQRRQPQTETVAFSRHNCACREETPEVCTMARAAHKCGVMAGVSDLVQACEESDQG